MLNNKLKAINKIIKKEEKKDKKAIMEVQLIKKYGRIKEKKRNKKLRSRKKRN